MMCDKIHEKGGESAGALAILYGEDVRLMTGQGGD